jgi:hypothetical protein
MAEEQLVKESSQLSSYDAYFERIQSRKKLPQSLQEILTAAFANIPASSFPSVPGGKGDIYCFCSFRSTNFACNEMKHICNCKLKLQHHFLQ